MAHVRVLVPFICSPLYVAGHNRAEKKQQQAYLEFQEEKRRRDAVVGALLWLAACTRPNLTYTTSVLVRFVSNPARVHYVAMQRVLAFLQTTANTSLVLRPGGSLGVVVYTDSSWDEKLSVSGGAIFFMNALVVWYARRQRTVSHSSVEAEYISTSLATWSS